MKQNFMLSILAGAYEWFRHTYFFNSISYLIEGKSNLALSIFSGGLLAQIFSYIKTNTPSEILGCSITLWTVAFAVNFWDIYTGILADVKVQKEKGGKWKFNPDKGQKAFEKIIGFTIIIYVLNSFELEAIRLSYSQTVSNILNYSKFIFFFYVVLIELKSIGRNNETRFKEKSDLFKMLDNIISIVNDGIVGYLKRFFKINKNQTDEENN